MFTFIILPLILILYLQHAGVSTLITSLRNKFWIFSLRVLAKKVCKECVLCQRQDSRACSQVTAPLPSDRIDRSHPFSVVGTDHAGPLYCEDTGDKKHYILLFTCGVVRAVHLELVPSLSLNDFMIAFRKHDHWPLATTMASDLQPPCEPLTHHMVLALHPFSSVCMTANQNQIWVGPLRFASSTCINVKL